jgi:hypothetical protein
MGAGALSCQDMATMSNLATTQNFIDVMKSFSWPEPKTISYRLYHDDQGRPLFYSMEDLPGTYIEVDQATYVTSPGNVKVVDGKLIMMPPGTTVTKLQPDATQGQLCDPRDICVVVDSGVPYQRWRQHGNDVS